jgi:hypothetical protein
MKGGGNSLLLTIGIEGYIVSKYMKIVDGRFGTLDRLKIYG